MYAEIVDLYLMYGENNLKQLLHDKANISPLNRALENASSEIDGYLNKRYKTPLLHVPNLVKEWVCIIAFYKLSTDYGAGLTEERRKRYEDIFRYLKDIAKGDAEIPELNNQEDTNLKPQGKDNTIQISCPNRRLITRLSLRRL
ncbi:DUF1320 domain-containing protein [Candidatus Hepatincolaceae symbiont of Richtersius coronifer]